VYYCINTRGGINLFTLNPNSGIPIYRQLMEQVRRMVSSGQLLPGNELPSVRELALNHAVNPMTISKAYSLLEAEGLLERQRGKAMTIAAQHVNKESKNARLERLQPAIDHLAMAAKQLQLNPEDVLKAVRHAMEKPDD
jgi:GntR family transcriptional regulator